MLAVILALALSMLPGATAPVFAVSTTVVISQVYGGGGNSGATLTNDFVELFNRGTATVSLAGWSIQYTSATGTGNFGSASNLITPLSGSLAPGQYLLVQEASNAAVGSPLPAPDVTDDTPISMAAGAGKVALVNTTTPLACNGSSTACSPAALVTIVDLVGYGNANFFEGATAAPTISATLADVRRGDGCIDTDNNGADFTATTPAPRNSASQLHVCPVADTAPAVTSSFPANGAADFPIGANLTVTFSESVNVTSSWFTLSCSSSGDVATTFSGGPTSFTLDPGLTLVDGETCTLTVLADQVSDQDANDPPDNMATNFLVGFTAVDVCVQSVHVDPCYSGQWTVSCHYWHRDYDRASLSAISRGLLQLRASTCRTRPATAIPPRRTASSSSPAAANLVSVGQVVRVTGYARERFNQTTLNGSNSNTAAVPAANIVQCGTGSVAAGRRDSAVRHC